MAVSNRVKRNIWLTFTVMGCLIVVSRILDPVMSGAIAGHDWFDIFGAVVITLCAFVNFKIYRNMVKDGIMFGRRYPKSK